MKNKTKTNSSNVVKLAVLGASIAGVAATAYFFLGPKGKKHQQHAKAWAIKMKGDIVEKLEMVRDISEPIYHEIIDSVAAEYENRKRAGNKEIKALAQDLKKHWKTLISGAQAMKSVVKKGAGRVAKKAQG